MSYFPCPIQSIKIFPASIHIENLQNRLACTFNIPLNLLIKCPNLHKIVHTEHSHVSHGIIMGKVKKTPAVGNLQTSPDKSISPVLGSVIGNMLKVVAMIFLSCIIWHFQCLFNRHMHRCYIPRVHKYCSSSQ